MLTFESPREFFETLTVSLRFPVEKYFTSSKNLGLTFGKSILIFVFYVVCMKLFNMKVCATLQAYKVALHVRPPDNILTINTSMDQSVCLAWLPYIYLSTVVNRDYGLFCFSVVDRRTILVTSWIRLSHSNTYFTFYKLYYEKKIYRGIE